VSDVTVNGNVTADVNAVSVQNEPDVEPPGKVGLKIRV
jgi:O-glycosyl hydrolase